MIIANPIYDSVFKYLLDDADIAKELLSTILNEEIVSIEVKPQETVTEIDSHSLTVFRLDFKAIIKLPDNSHKKVLIELQKAKKLFDIMRFRRYLADNYQKTDTIVDANGEEKNTPLPIITVYFLGFPLKKGLPAVFKTQHEITDVVTGEILQKRPKEPFVELLHHNSYTIQIPLLTDKLQTRIEKVLMVFSPIYKTDDRHKLDYVGKTDDILINKILNRLIRAVADEQVRKQMDVEDEIENTIANLLREKDEIIEKKDEIIEKKDELLGQKEKELAEYKAIIEALKKQMLDNKGNE